MDEQTYTKEINAAMMAENNLALVAHELRKPSNAGIARTQNFINRAKIWLTTLDLLVPRSVYLEKLCRSLTRATIDIDQLTIEYVKQKNVIIIDGAFDLDELRKYLLSI
jgi:hypothetical protein